MTIVVSELAIETDRGRVTLRREPDGRVRVKWFCGDERVFSKDDLREAINAAEKVKPHEDVWLQLKDSTGLPVALSFANGEMRADRRPDVNARSVPWDDLRKAARRVME